MNAVTYRKINTKYRLTVSLPKIDLTKFNNDFSTIPITHSTFVRTISELNLNYSFLCHNKVKSFYFEVINFQV